LAISLPKLIIQQPEVQSHLMDAAGALKDKVQQAPASVGDAIDDLAGKGS
jgi:hypothetical protein